jgi:8-oxo-dGTP diphosphatase
MTSSVTGRRVPTGYKYRIKVYYEATLAGDLSSLSLDPREILEARLFRLDDLPVAMPDLHRELAVLGPAQAGTMPG